MQKPINFPQNYLLSHVIRFLHGEEDNFENIKTLIDHSSINHLVLTFSFLIKWLPKHLIDESTTEIYNDYIQIVIQFIGLIIQKVPPVILYHELPENEIESADCSHWLVSELLDPIKQRIMRLRSYILPKNVFRFHCSIPQVFSSKKDHRSYDEHFLRIEKNITPDFEAQVLKYMKSLIMNHIPIQSFQSFSTFQHSRIILTNVIIQLLEELNQARKATHEELLFAFSSIFLYVYALAFNNEIDGQALCTYIRSRSFLSPFCILGIVKYIISYLYLFNLLTPKEFIDDNAETQENQKSNKPPPYVSVDLTNDKTLTPLIQKIPAVLLNYFIPKTVKKENSQINNNDLQDDNTFYAYMHLSTVDFNTKMRSAFMISKDKFLTPAHVYSIGLLLLRYIIFQLQRTLVSFVDNNMFTPNFSVFVKTVFSILTTTFSEPLASKFYDSNNNDVKIINVTICGSFLHLLPVILRSFNIDYLINYCLKAIKDNGIARNGRIMITKILQCDYPKISPELVENIKETRDLITLLIYIDALTNFKYTRNYKEANKLEESRLILLNQLIVGNTYADELNATSNVTFFDEKPFIFRPFKALSTIDRQFNAFSKSIIQASESPTQIQSMSDLLVSLGEEDQPWVLYYFSLTSCIENESFSETMTDQIVAGLENKENKKNLKADNFIVNKNDHYYVVAQSILGRLVYFKYTKAAVKLSQAMIPYMSNDLAILHYITNFLAKFRSICPIGVLESFQQVVSNLPYSDEFYNLNRYLESTTLPIGLTSTVHSNFINKVFAITKMLEQNQCKIIQNSNVVTQEYQSPFQHAMAFALCSLGLTTSLQNTDSSNIAVNEITDNSLNMISNPMNSFDSAFYNPLMDFGTGFDSSANFDATPSLTSGFGVDPTPPKQTTNSNTTEIVPENITDEIAEALLSPVTCFTKIWNNRDVAIKLCSMVAAKMDNKIAMKYLDLIIKGNNNDLYVQAGISFLMNANLNILEYACQSLTNYITDFNTNFSNHGNDNYNAKIDFFFKILMPSVWRIQGETRVGMILMDGILKSITKQTPKKLFNTVIDIISYVYIKLELYDNKTQIVQSAISSGYSPEMVTLIEASLPDCPLY